MRVRRSWVLRLTGDSSTKVANNIIGGADLPINNGGWAFRAGMSASSTPT